MFEKLCSTFSNLIKWTSLSKVLLQVSISSTFYVRIFCTKLWRKKFQSCVLGLKYFGAKISVQNEHVKCWCNWQQVPLACLDPIRIKNVYSRIVLIRILPGFFFWKIRTEPSRLTNQRRTFLILFLTFLNFWSIKYHINSLWLVLLILINFSNW